MTRMREGLGNPIGGGMDTTRSTTPATPEEAAAREAILADALAYLTRKGLHDVAEILGLVHVPVTKPRRVYGTPRDCAHCGKTFSASSFEQITCSRSCGGKHGAKNRTKETR